jgi:hypothetical protein
MYYVTMTDKFLSGWGAAAGKINKLVIECQTHQDAERVARNARQRHEMRRVSIRATKPCYRPDSVLTSWRSFDDLHGAWKA